MRSNKDDSKNNMIRQDDHETISNGRLFVVPINTAFGRLTEMADGLFVCSDIGKRYINIERGGNATRAREKGAWGGDRMKEVVSVSLGSSTRNHRIRLNICGETVRIVRIGTDGDIRKAKNWIRRLDGRADAIGLGGIDRYLTIAGKRYPFRQAESLAREAKCSPVCDGSALKNTLERDAVLRLERVLGSLQGRRVLLLSAADRYGMAETFADCGAHLTCGDLIYGLGLPMPVQRLSTLRRLATWLLPIVTRCPIHTLYPVGRAQTQRRPRFTRYFDEADIIAGDYHYLHRYMPDRLYGKIIVTNTTTEEDRAFLKKSGARLLVTTTPIFGGRSFGTNVMEAVIMALSGGVMRGGQSLWLTRTGIEPQVLPLG